MFNENKSCEGALLFPVTLIGFVLFVSLAFQTSLVLRDRTNLEQSIADQTKPLEQAKKVEAQLDSIALGTQKLAASGNKSAQMIVERLKQSGINITPPEKAEAEPSTPATKPTP